MVSDYIVNTLQRIMELSSPLISATMHLHNRDLKDVKDSKRNWEYTQSQGCPLIQINRSSFLQHNNKSRLRKVKADLLTLRILYKLVFEPWYIKRYTTLIQGHTKSRSSQTHPCRLRMYCDCCSMNRSPGEIPWRVEGNEARRAARGELGTAATPLACWGGPFSTVGGASCGHDRGLLSGIPW